MRDSLTNHKREFEEMVGNISTTIHQMSDPVAIGTMLYSIAEEKKSSNLIVRDINGKFDNIIEKLEKIVEELSKLNVKLESEETLSAEISERDQEILDFVQEKEKACAEDVQEKFEYKGRNAASARLSKLFREGLLDKKYVGRKVYYVLKN